MDNGISTHELVDCISKKCTLDPATIKDLLEEGWTFVEELGQVNKWLSPSAMLEFKKTR